jgi:hypothetical protein
VPQYTWTSTVHAHRFVECEVNFAAGHGQEQSNTGQNYIKFGSSIKLQNKSHLIYFQANARECVKSLGYFVKVCIHNDFIRRLIEVPHSVHIYTTLSADT